MPRLRFLDYRTSGVAQTLGLCSDNRRELAAFANSAERRLVLAPEAGDEGWWGTWAEVGFTNVSRTNPFITTPRSIARIEKLDICRVPIPVHNQFYEYLDFGNGRLPKTCQGLSWCTWDTKAVTRNNTILFVDQSVVPCYIRVYCRSSNDESGSKRVLIQGKNTSDNTIRTVDNDRSVDGEFVTLQAPFGQTALQFNSINGIQKDETEDAVEFYQVDPSTNEETLVLVMEPSETVAGYRRYYLNDLPKNCCCFNTSTEADLTVTAICKLQIVPVTVDTDYFLLQNIEALIEESIAIRMSRMDNAEAQQLAATHHKNAIRYLNSEITHYLGKQSPAVNFAPFGTARLECQKIGTLI